MGRQRPGTPRSRKGPSGGTRAVDPQGTTGRAVLLRRSRKDMVLLIPCSPASGPLAPQRRRALWQRTEPSTARGGGQTAREAKRTGRARAHAQERAAWGVRGTPKEPNHAEGLRAARHLGPLHILCKHTSGTGGHILSTCYVPDAVVGALRTASHFFLSSLECTIMSQSRVSLLGPVPSTFLPEMGKLAGFAGDLGSQETEKA